MTATQTLPPKTPPGTDRNKKGAEGAGLRPRFHQHTVNRLERIMTIAGLALLVLLLTVRVAAAATEHCPDHNGNPGKVEGGQLNDIVLEAGTVFCVKGSTDAVSGTADGTTTLAAYLGNDHDVSYYVVYSRPTPPPPPPEETTTTTTEVPNETTTTVAEETTTTTAAPTTTVSNDTPSVTTTPTPVERTELPYTGIDPAFLLGSAGLLASSGAYLVRKYR